MGFVPLSQSQHGRDGHAPFFCREKSKSYLFLVSNLLGACFQNMGLGTAPVQNSGNAEANAHQDFS
jgi:hypothetical protein